jgi:hypothetical protein
VKKLAIGCAVVVMLFALAGALTTYWLYRKVTTTVGQFAELASVPELERQVSNTQPFAPPPSGVLTQPQVDRLLQVQTRVRQRLGERFAEMQEKYRALLDKKEATALDLPELVSAYRDLAATWMDAKRAQVDALNLAGFSLEEYRWVRQQAYAALGIPIVEIDVSRLINDATQGTSAASPGQLGGSMGPSGPEENRALVEGAKKALEENAVLASFGL